MPIFEQKVKQILNIDADPNNFPYFKGYTKGYSRIKEKSIVECRKNESLNESDAMKTVVDMIRASIIYTNITKMLEDVDTMLDVG